MMFLLVILFVLIEGHPAIPIQVPFWYRYLKFTDTPALPVKCTIKAISIIMVNIQKLSEGGGNEGKDSSHLTESLKSAQIIPDNTMFAQSIQTTIVCPTDYVGVGNKCYHFSTKEIPWTESRFYCQSSNGSLAVINSYRENNQLKDFFSSTSNKISSLASNEYWIDGIYDWEQSMWKWGGTGQYIHFHKFTRNKGDKYKWKCISLDGAKNNKWLARRCTDRKRVICEKSGNIIVQFNNFDQKKKKFDISKCSSGQTLEKYQKKRCLKLLGNQKVEESAAYAHQPKIVTRRKNTNWVCPPYMVLLGSKCYSFSTVATPWNDAHFECRKNGSKLAIIRNRSQDRNLRRFLNHFIEKHERWIGGIFDWKTDTWRWAMSGQSITYKGFHNEAIKRETPGELSWNSIFMDPKWDNQWNADKQTEKKHYICQIKARAVKTLRHPNKTIPHAAVINVGA